MSHLSAQGITVEVDGRVLVDSFAFDAPTGSWTTIIGPNGAGKTTLIRAMLGLVRYSGGVLLDGRSVNGRALARRVAYVPQRPERPPGMRVVDYVTLGRTPHLGYFGRESERDWAAVNEALAVMDLGELAARDVASLSGGEAQRVALARAVAQEATLLILDEPTTGLDIGRQQEVMALIDGLRRARSLTVIATMHDLTIAAQVSDVVMLMNGGRLIHRGSAGAVVTPDLIGEHYGAEVAVITDEDGHLHVIPKRSGTAGRSMMEQR